MSGKDGGDLRFSAQVATFEDDGFATTIAFANDRDAPALYAIIQFTNAPTEADIRLGHDSPHIEVHPSGVSGYGLIESVEYSFPLLLLVLKLPAHGRQMRVEIDVAGTAWDEVKLAHIAGEIQRRVY